MSDPRKDGPIAIKFWSLQKQISDLTKEIDDLTKENQELKKQLEDEQSYSQSVFCDFQDYKEEVSDYLDKTEKQFIEYLEDKLSIFNNILDTEGDEDGLKE